MIDFEEYKPVIRIAARTNFWAFCCYMDYDFFAVRRRFLKDIAMIFQRVADNYKNGVAINAAISLPPRSGKSYITSCFCAWWLGIFPETSVMRNTCTSTLYDKLSYDTRAILISPEYKNIFPEILISADKANLGGWNTNMSKQVGYFGAGVGGTIIGFGANIAITDDLYKSMQDALSDTTDAKVKMWKQSAHDSRKEKNCPEIFIGTRWRVSDIIGMAISSGEVYPGNIYCVPAMTDGKSFCEDVKTTAEYLKIKNKIDESVWLAEYQQEPIEAKGLLLPLSELKFCDMSKIRGYDIKFSFSVGDPADKGGDKYSMVFLHVVKDNDDLSVYVSDVIHNTDGIEVNTQKILNRLPVETPEEIYIESNGVGLASIIDLKKTLKRHTVLKNFPSRDEKEVRILSNYEFIKKYFVFNKGYESISEYNSFIADLTSYLKEGDNKHKKDAIDVCSLASKILKIKYRSFLYGG
jgi:hypothetical protein